jgi:hypothetical protein
LFVDAGQGVDAGCALFLMSVAGLCLSRILEYAGRVENFLCLTPRLIHSAARCPGTYRHPHTVHFIRACKLQQQALPHVVRRIKLNKFG